MSPSLHLTRLAKGFIRSLILNPLHTQRNPLRLLPPSFFSLFSNVIIADFPHLLQISRSKKQLIFRNFHKESGPLSLKSVYQTSTLFTIIKRFFPFPTCYRFQGIRICWHSGPHKSEKDEHFSCTLKRKTMFLFGHVKGERQEHHKHKLMDFFGELSFFLWVHGTISSFPRSTRRECNIPPRKIWGARKWIIKIKIENRWLPNLMQRESWREKTEFHFTKFDNAACSFSALERLTYTFQHTTKYRRHNYQRHIIKGSSIL